MNADLMLNAELESGLSEMLDTCLNYVENVLIQEEIMDANRMML
jgi:hypothetical protein